MKKMTRSDWMIPAVLIILSLVPMLGGIVRVHHVVAGTPGLENARFVTSPVPIFIHIVVATLYSLLGAFQFSRGMRMRWPGWHRKAGWVLVLSGMASALTGIWMAVVYAIPAEIQGPILLVVRVLVGTGMAVAIVLGVRAAIRRDFKRHEAWMIRAYALGMGAAMQAVLMGPWIALVGPITGLTRDVLLSLAWGINLTLAEWIIRRLGGPRKARVSLAGT